MVSTSLLGSCSFATIRLCRGSLPPAHSFFTQESYRPLVRSSNRKVSNAVKWFFSWSEQLLAHSVRFKVLTCLIRAKGKTLFMRSPLRQVVVGMQPVIIRPLKSSGEAPQLVAPTAVTAGTNEEDRTPTDARYPTAVERVPYPATKSCAVYESCGVAQPTVGAAAAHRLSENSL